MLSAQYQIPVDDNDKDLRNTHTHTLPYLWILQMDKCLVTSREDAPDQHGLGAHASFTGDELGQHLGGGLKVG